MIRVEKALWTGAADNSILLTNDCEQR